MSEPKVTVLAEKGNQVLIKIETRHELLPGKFYKGIRYEWWTDKSKMRDSVYEEYKDGHQYFYCSGFSGSDEEELVSQFEEEVQGGK